MKGKQVRIKCNCGANLEKQRLIKSGMRECPSCGAPLHTLYGETKTAKDRRKKRLITLNCLCGASYKIERPQGDFIYPCKACGRVLLQARVGTLNLKGVNTFGNQA